MIEYIVDVFTHEGKGGNKAGVIILTKDLSQEKCQEIAAKLHFSETVFIKKMSDKIFELKFYTPECRIEFCGHASLAAFYILKKNKIIEDGEYIERLDFKDLNVIVQKDKIFLEQDDFKIDYNLDSKEVLDSLDIDKDFLYEDLKPVIGYTGLRDILISVKSRELLNGLNLDYNKIKEISKKYDVIGYHIYTFDNNKIYCRNFAPLYGINEEAATGSSNGALFAYLNTFDRFRNECVEFFQGENYGEISKIIVKFIKDKIYVGSEFKRVE
ncbi:MULTISPECIES: PhzF family phenazine biosynthesis protein [unclassified Cetobacterium]|uniref:PhzF family phenazine biosynthesis protein n=1 Tax=unclassified Cetobacterium TaxID=2630983 RepID=UPI0006475279|nr:MULTISPECIES: PhzF family phenazine biosynthesis protein [unclassified Cetobacterium]